MPEIKACPNCGNHEHVASDNFDGAWYMFCHMCAMKGPTSYNEIDAIEKWNDLPRRETTAIRIDDISDYITNPDYYSCWQIEPLDFITANNLDFLRGNIIKYIMRYNMKDGLKDLKKARVYLDKLIEKMEKGKDG